MTTISRAELTLADAMASPCATCAGTPCCTNLPVHRLRVATLIDLDYIRYLLNFDALVVTLASNGEWSVFLGAACRHLDQASGRCRVHGQPDQPHICATYNPYTCWYKGALGSGGDSDTFRVDRRRWEVIAQRTVFDEGRHIIEAPSWDDLAAAFASQDDPPDDSPPPAAPVGEVAVAIGRPRGSEAEAGGRGATAPFATSPCTGCAAPCCTNVVFPYPIPDSATNLDFLRFALGFPGVRVVTGPDEWGIAVTSTCRHLADGRCSVIATAERPLRCSYYDEWRCTYKVTFGPSSSPPPPGVSVLDLDAFVELLPTFGVDDTGRINRGPTDAQIAACAARRSPG